MPKLILTRDKISKIVKIPHVKVESSHAQSLLVKLYHYKIVVFIFIVTKIVAIDWNPNLDSFYIFDLENLIKREIISSFFCLSCYLTKIYASLFFNLLNIGVYVLLKEGGFVFKLPLQTGSALRTLYYFEIIHFSTYPKFS